MARPSSVRIESRCTSMTVVMDGYSASVSLNHGKRERSYAPVYTGESKISGICNGLNAVALEHLLQLSHRRATCIIIGNGRAPRSRSVYTEKRHPAVALLPCECDR